jgi:hypothetical protein
MYFPLPNRLIIGHASHKLLNAIPIFDAWETQRGVVFLPHIVKIRLPAFLLDSTLNIFVLSMRRKQVVEIDLWVSLMATLSVEFPALGIAVNLGSAGAGVYFSLRRRRWR